MKTDWFESGYPRYHGVYERDIEGTKLFSYWNGIDWYVLARSPDRALMHYESGITSVYQEVNHDNRWRGVLAQEWKK
jgi:hypothetical protein